MHTSYIAVYLCIILGCTPFEVIADFGPWPQNPTASIQNWIDSDHDGLPDAVELSGLQPVLRDNSGDVDFEQFNPLLSTLSKTHPNLFEWVFENGITYTIGNQTYNRAWVSVSGMLSFGGPLDTAPAPIAYPLEKHPKNRLRRIPQVAFLQGDNALHGADFMYESHAYTAALEPNSSDFFLFNLHTDCVCNNHRVNIRIQIQSNQNIRIFYQGSTNCMFEDDLTQTHTIGYQSGEGGVMLERVPSCCYLELRSFTPTDPFCADTDGDGLSDGGELMWYGSDPSSSRPDFDGNGIPDALQGLIPSNPFTNLTEWVNSFVIDNDNDGWPNYWELALGSNPDYSQSRPNSTEWGLVWIRAACDRIPFTLIPCGDFSIPAPPGVSECAVPVRWGQVIDLPAGVEIQNSYATGGVILRDRSAPEDVFRFQAVRVFLEPANHEQGKWGQGSICIHPYEGPRTVTLRFGDWSGVFSLNFDHTDWFWPSSSGEGREFTTDTTSATLKIEPRDEGTLAYLGFYTVVSVDPAYSSWRVHSPLSPGDYGIERCPPPGELPPPEEGDEEEKHDSCPIHFIPGHCCLHSQLCHGRDNYNCEICSGEPCPGTCPPEPPFGSCYRHWDAAIDYHCCFHSHCGSGEDGQCPMCACPGETCPDCDPANPEEDEGSEEIDIASLHLGALRIDNNDSDKNGIRDYEQPHYINPDPDWRRLFLTIAPPLSGLCCPCPSHGNGGGYVTAYSDAISTTTADGRSLSTIHREDLPVYLQGLTPSQSFFDQSLIVTSRGHIATNLYTVGALALEPADRQMLIPKPATNTWVIPCGDFYPLVVKSEVFTPGAFTLTHTGSPAFELWIPPLTAATAEGAPYLYETYVADFLAGAIPEGSRLFNSPLAGTEADFYDDFILPTNRVVWVRALEPGATTLTYSYSKTVMGVAIRFSDTLAITALPPALLPDYDRNGLWDETDLHAAVNKEYFNFWRNDDVDEWTMTWLGWKNSTDTPQGENICDADDAVINGPKDFADFFPVKLNLKEHLIHYPPSRYTYTLDFPNLSLNPWSHSLTPAGAQWVADPLDKQPYLIDAAAIRDYARDSERKKITRHEGSLILSAELLASIAASDAPHALLLEGRTLTPDQSALTLYITHCDEPEIPLLREHAPIRIVPVESMFHYHNLLSFGGRTDNTIRDLYVPADAPWGQDSQKQLFFCHGYNVSSIAVRAWGCELFKRFFLSGNTAEFNMVHWYGFKSKTLESIPPTDFHSNVINAFQTAPALATLIGSKRESATHITLAGHSLGCMLVSAAVCLEHAMVDDLVLVNAAVALEAYDSETTQATEMTHEDMRIYANAGLNYLFASEWHKLFLNNADDPRNTLTIRDLFKNKNGVQFHQFYSSGEDVTGNVPLQTSVIAQIWNGENAVGRYAWGIQELWKGCSYEPFGPGAIIGSTWMGWSVNSHYRRYFEDWSIYPIWAIDDLAEVSKTNLVTQPFFDKTPSELFVTNSVSAMVYAQTNRFEIIARAIPARTFSAGANKLNERVDFKNYVDMNSFVNSVESGPWLRTTGSDPTKWKHSDIRDMPYVNVFPFFKRVADIANK